MGGFGAFRTSQTHLWSSWDAAKPPWKQLSFGSPLRWIFEVLDTCLFPASRIRLHFLYPLLAATRPTILPSVSTSFTLVQWMFLSLVSVQVFRFPELLPFVAKLRNFALVCWALHHKNASNLLALSDIGGTPRTLSIALPLAAASTDSILLKICTMPCPPPPAVPTQIY